MANLETSWRVVLEILGFFHLLGTVLLSSNATILRATSQNRSIKHESMS